LPVTLVRPSSFFPFFPTSPFSLAGILTQITINVGIFAAQGFSRTSLVLSLL
jgi:hypothetical protein